MYVKNTSPKTIGFGGSMYLIPGDCGELPKGFDENHPTIKFYFKKKWLEKTEKKESGKGGKKPKTKEEEIAAKIKAVAKMNLDPLKEEAASLGIDFDDSATRAILQQKITEKLQEELG